MLVLEIVLEQIPDGGDIMAAVFGQLFHFPLPGPFNHLETVSYPLAGEV